MEKQQIIFQDLGTIRYKDAWDFQELLLSENLAIKSILRNSQDTEKNTEEKNLPETSQYLFFCEHPPVYTLGKSGHPEHVLISQEELTRRNIEFFRTNRGGDITFHGPEQVVGYPLLDLEKSCTDLGKYLRNLEEVIILTLAHYGIKGERSAGETGVWLDPHVAGKARKICAMGIRCSRWLTMHGFALNVNTDLTYFNHIIPCGIAHKQVTSMSRELNRDLDMAEVHTLLRNHFCDVFDVELKPEKVRQQKSLQNVVS